LQGGAALQRASGGHGVIVAVSWHERLRGA